jgi:glutaconate CoA-transferase subunit A
MSLAGPYMSVDELAARVPDGALIGLSKDDSGTAMALTRALIRRGVRNLHVVCVPVGGLQADILIGAGCVATIECSGVSFGELGLAPRFRDAVQSGAIRIKDATCPAIYAAVQAGEKAVPFAPIRGIIGSDVLRHRDDWKVVQNPFSDTTDPIVLVKAINPDVTMFHARWGDRFGNVWIGKRRELATLAHAAKETLVTVEEIVDFNLMSDEKLVGSTISSLYVTALAHAPRGAAPLNLDGVYDTDRRHIRDYVREAATVDGFAAYLDRTVFGTRAAA